MNDLYYGVHPFVDAAEAGFTFDADVLKAAVKRVYERKFNPMTEIDEGVFNETWRVFNEAAAKGFADAGASARGDEEFFEQIKHNNAVFSAFRTHRLQNDIASRLLDENGKLKTFEQFSKDVKGITDHSVKQWLRTEYDTAVIRAHNASDWQRFASVKDVLPNLRWMQTTSVTPDEIHRQFWSAGLTLPQEHPFWNLHRPGDRWNCKCYLEATDAPVKGEHLYEHPATPYKPAAGLDNNPGQDGKLFSDTHPYIANAYKGAEKAVKQCLEAAQEKNEQQALSATLYEIKELKATLFKDISPYEGIVNKNKLFLSGQITVLRNSLDNVAEHADGEKVILKWAATFNPKNSLKGWQYRGYAENRTAKHDKYSSHFHYYSKEIDGKTYWAHVMVRKDYGETLYVIKDVKPDDLIEGKKE